MKLAVVGSRDFTDYALMKEELMQIHLVMPITEVISGGARGADSLAERFAKEFNIPTKIFPAEWDKHGKSAGYLRNTDIVKAADRVIAFFSGKETKGTLDTISKAIKLSKPVSIYGLNKR
jgi:hypothetical protein